MAARASSPSTTASTDRQSFYIYSQSSVSLYKGKLTNRSWQQLPPEIIRLIATQYIHDASATNYCPQTWEASERWDSRIVYAALRDANDMEKLMRVCPTWQKALETHLFWHQACVAIDPHDDLIHHAIAIPPITAQTAASALPSLPSRILPHQHFRNMTNCSCYVCRVNSPLTSAGLTAAKRPVLTPYLGTILVCREHRRNSFCGLCLREAPPLEHENDYNLVLCVENEDDETWPGVDATCRSCRSEWLWRRVATNPKDREAVGGIKYNSPDWETRQTVEAFIEMGEGTISDVITLAQEKHWLHSYTKLHDMLSQALAASRYATREEGLCAKTGYTSEDEFSDDDIEDEDDPELMSLTEDAGGVRELAINDWARNRILDGHWFNPADQWYGNSIPNRSTVVRAVHPCPWTRDTASHVGGRRDALLDADGEEIHPRPVTYRADVPPTFQLCEQAYVAYQKQIRLILLPAMANIVRRVVMECKADGADPAIRVSKMDPEEVVTELRDEAVWYNGIDWLERRANNRHCDLSSRQNREDDRKEKDDGDDSSASSKSDDSHTTSPVLSTSTLQTSPSPPPSEVKKDEDRATRSGMPRPPTIPVSPVLQSPILLHPIPYVPTTVSHMPSYSLEAIKMVWREACAPLYHCRCKICERAMANASRGSIAPRQAGAVPPRDPVPTQVVTERPVEIRIEAATPADLEGEDEIEDDEEESDYEDDDDDLSVEEVTNRALNRSVLDVVRTQYSHTRALKRRSAVFEDDTVRHVGHQLDSPRDGTPPKRARMEQTEPGLVSLKGAPHVPERLKKRNSEELQDDEEDGRMIKKKRPKVDAIADVNNQESSDGLPSSPTSIDGSESIPSIEDDELRYAAIRRLTGASYGTSKPRSLHRLQGRRTASNAPLNVRQPDLDQLYTFET